MIFALLLAAFGLIQHDVVPTDRVAVIELNHVRRVEPDCEYKLDQWIAWDYYHGELHVVAWWMMSEGKLGGERGRWLLLVRRSNGFIAIRAPSYYETWTTWDPEVRDRDLLPVEDRRPICVTRKGGK